MVAMNQVESPLKIIKFNLYFKKKWFENPGRDSLVSERSLRKLRPLGRLLSQWVACVCLLFDFWHTCAWALTLHWHWSLGYSSVMYSSVMYYSVMYSSVVYSFGDDSFLRWLTVGQHLDFIVLDVCYSYQNSYRFCTCVQNASASSKSQSYSRCA